MSWWGPNSFEDASLNLVVARVSDFGLKVTAYCESLADGAVGLEKSARVDAAEADIAYLLDRYGQDPSWLRVAGCPVIFV